jgi:hypothetical protein
MAAVACYPQSTGRVTSTAAPVTMAVSNHRAAGAQSATAA